MTENVAIIGSDLGIVSVLSASLSNLDRDLVVVVHDLNVDEQKRQLEEQSMKIEIHPFHLESKDFYPAAYRPSKHHCNRKRKMGKNKIQSKSRQKNRK